MLTTQLATMLAQVTKDLESLRGKDRSPGTSGDDGKELPSASRSLALCFKDVEPAHITSIMRHEFEARHLFKLDPLYKDNVERSSYIINPETNRVEVEQKATKEFKNYASLSIPLSLFFQILVTSAPPTVNRVDLSRHTLQYMQRLAQFSLDFEWNAVLNYHTAFFNRCRKEMLNDDWTVWGTVDHDLKGDHLFNRQKVMQPKTSSGKKIASTGIAPGTTICNKFNQGTCSTPCHWNRQHTCLTCAKTDHGSNTCAMNKKSNSAS